MKQPALVFLSLLCLAAHATPHGVTYPPAPNGPPPEAGPSTPTPTTPTGPAMPAGPSTGSGSPPAPGGPKSGSGGGAAATAGANPVEDASWEKWWLYNQDRYLRLKTHVDALDIRTGGDADWLGGSTGGPPTTEAVEKNVVPALLALFERERSNEILTGATIALARLADGPVAARAGEFSRTFAGFMSDPNQEVAETAVLGRGLVGDGGAAFDLSALLADTEAARAKNGGKAIPTRTRTFAAYALGFLAASSKNEDVRRYVVHQLVNTLQAERGATSDVHVACVLALGLAPLAWENRAEVPAAASKSASTIATASRQTQIECLLDILGDQKGDRWVRAHASSSLSKLADGASPPTQSRITDALLAPLIPNTQERDEVVQGCVLALGHIADVDVEAGDARVRATLQRLTSGGDRQTRCFALIALAQRAAHSKDAQRAAETRAFLGKRLNEGRAHERAWAALGLGIIEHERNDASEVNSLSVRTSLVAALNDCGSPEELGALAIACGLARETTSVKVLIDKLERASDGRVQGPLVLALGLIGDPRAVAPLRTLLATARFRPDLLRQTAIGLALLEDPTLIPSLLTTLEKAGSMAAQAAAASVIGWIGDHRALPALLGLLNNRDVTASARGFAAVALGRVCDRDRLPWNAQISEDVHYRAATVTLIASDGTGLLEIL